MQTTMRYIFCRKKMERTFKMKITKRIAALIIAAIMVMMLTACGDTSWIVKVDGETVNSGSYIYYQTAGYTAAGYELAAQNQDYYYYMIYGLSYIDEKIGDKTVTEYMNDYALSMCKQYVVIERLFDELGLELTDDDKAIIDVQVNNLWNNSSSAYEKAGIAKSTIEKIAVNSYKENMVFNSYYEVGGLNGTTEDDIKGYLEDNYVRIKYMSFDFADNTDDAIDEQRKADALSQAQSYLDRAAAGESMNSLIKELNDLRAEADAAENGETIPDNSEASPADEENSDAEEDLDVEEQEPEYAYETVLMKDSKNPSEKFVNYVFNEVKTGEIKLVQDDMYIYVVQKLDVLERTDIYDSKRESFIKDLFNDDFTNLVNEKLSGYSVEVNEASVKRYDPKRAMGADKK